MLNLNAIKIHLTLKSHHQTDGLVYESCLTSALRETRLMSGRNSETGLPDSENKFGYLGHWLGAMGYITILDQIGKCYRPFSKSKISGKPPIEIALHYFSELNDKEIAAIYALRNAFFHDFSLYNHNSKDDYQHTFTVHKHPSSSVVVLPEHKWNGNLQSRSKLNTTFINLKTLGDLVENIYSKLLQLESEGNLILELQGGNEELLAKYIYAHP